MTLPSFETIRRNAHRMLGDTEQELQSDWSDPELTTGQAKALADARRNIRLAKAALDKAARAGGDGS
ncbi:hypothetical protein E1287_07100 [Actinomadura sp. KC06]|uniref:hypothetical protein n=1 Tax=Actinomadura sp. KC06 TaxID=2530369 RepID=UPI001045F753|nr:hypothetical protein [Actinomadura sp. KC06]TDD37820.1 hypothetical protein E1287_07100 [Actinomadura sp. KC06]